MAAAQGMSLPRRTRCQLAILSLSGLWTAALLVLPLDPPPTGIDPKSVASLKMTDREGRPLREVWAREDGRSHWLSWREVPPMLVRATLAAEDRRFFDHPGVDALALMRAMLQALRYRRVVSGASTITMQLARVLDPRPRTLKSKLRQMATAWALERFLSKPEILLEYLNRAPYGRACFGVAAAARRYFDKPLADLTIAEAALLAALPRSPSGYNSLTRGRGRLLVRQRRILRAMHELGWLSAVQYRVASAQRPRFARRHAVFAAAHFAERVLHHPLAARAVEVRTTIDLELQQRVERAVRETVTRLRDKGVRQAAVLVVDNSSAEVLAYVGSADFFSDQAGQVDGVVSQRQPGSSIKPFTYALALERGMTAATLLQDLPAHYATEAGDYAPRNYDRAFHGPVRLRTALGSSYNVAAVRAARFVGVEPLLRRLRAAGFSSLRESARHYGLGLTLGNGEVRLDELVAGYLMLASRGRYRPLRIVRWAIDAGGAYHRQAPVPPRRVFDARVAALVGDILADPVARQPSFGRGSALENAFGASVKTGTSKDFRDNWTVGYTRRLTVGVWVGNFEGLSMRDVSGVTGAAPLWSTVLSAAERWLGAGSSATRLLAGTRPTGRSGLLSRRICPLSGRLIGAHCPHDVRELFRPEHLPLGVCDFHRLLAIDRRNGLLASRTCPRRYVVQRALVSLPPVYAAWSDGMPQRAPTRYSPLCPPTLRPARGEASEATVALRFPQDGDRYFVDPDLQAEAQQLPLEAVVKGGAERVEFLVDGQVEKNASFPYRTVWRLRPGRHRIVARLADGTRSKPVHIVVQ